MGTCPCMSITDDKAFKEEIPSSELIPLICLINRKGGGGTGKKLLLELDKLSGCHSIDILEFAGDGKKAVEERLSSLCYQKQNFRVVLCGGDGTLTWGFKILDSLSISCPISFIPVGTANEISYCTGWGHKFDIKHLPQIVHSARSEELIDFDTWDIIYEDDPESLKKHPPGRRPAIMAAFLSIGIDANIATCFHRRRENRKKQVSVWRSELTYANCGMKELMKNRPPIGNDAVLTIDGVTSEITGEYKCIQVLNICSMSSRRDFFGKGKSKKKDALKEGDYKQPKLNDGLLEVLGQKSVFLYGLSYANLSRGERIGQGAELVFELKKEMPVQIDGEPFLNPKGKIFLRRGNVRRVVKGSLENWSTRRGI